MQLFIGEIKGNKALLSEEESRHFTKVLRGKTGQEIHVTDGSGNMVRGIVTMISPKSVEIEISELKENFEKRSYHLHVAISPTKNMDRTEFFLEKAVEIGIDEITFIKCFHSERKNINLERCQKIIQSAAKQSLKAYIPKLNDMLRLSEFLSLNPTGQKFMAHCDTAFSRENFNEIIQPKSNYLILIGPEGDFSKEEIQTAEKQGFTGISLGNQRMRTETAALVAVLDVNRANLM